MKKHQKIIPVLALAILLSSCGQAAVSDASGTTTETGSDVTTAPEPEYEYADIDLGGDSFTLLNTSQT